MKKRFILSILTIITFVLLTSCNSNKTPEKSKNELIQDALNKIYLPEEVTTDLTLLETVDEFNITWVSDNTECISNDGKVTRSMLDSYATMSATISSDGITLSKSFSVKVLAYETEEALQNALNKISLPKEVTTKIDLPDKVDIFVVTWQSNNTDVITNKGKITQGLTDIEVELKATVSYSNVKVSRTFIVKVLKNENFVVIDDAISQVQIPSRTSVDIKLPTSVGEVNITWTSSKSAYLTNDGKVTRDALDKEVLLTAVYTYGTTKITKYYDIVIECYTDVEKLQIVLDQISFNENLKSDLVLNTNMNYGITAEWSSNNSAVLTNTGKYTYDENIKTVKLTLTVTLGSETMTKEFEFNTLPKEEFEKQHLLIKRAEEYDSSKFDNVILQNGKLVLAPGASIGTYESEIIETLSFNELVASWAAVSSTTSTVELQIKVRVNNVWSEYISYKQFGLGLQNACYDQSNSLIKLSTDEVIVQNGQKADAIVFKVTLRTTANTTPELSLVALALNIPGYTFPVDISSYPQSVIHEVPRLYQQVVPTIGNSICSATSSTMLLKYKGEDFTSFDAEYEHRYIAGIVRDYGNGIYGNWVYNTVGMSGYGYDAYVARFYSINELIEHLATVGPCALSVKGQMNSDKKNYYTNGHLIVAIGYEIGENGNITIVCNDPNVSSVECRYSLSVMNNTWRNVAYIIE